MWASKLGKHMKNINVEDAALWSELPLSDSQYKSNRSEFPFIVINSKLHKWKIIKTAIVLWDNRTQCICSCPVCLNTIYFASWNMDTWHLPSCESWYPTINITFNFEKSPIPIHELENLGKNCRSRRDKDSCEQCLKVTEDIRKHSPFGPLR